MKNFVTCPQTPLVKLRCNDNASTQLQEGRSAFLMLNSSANLGRERGRGYCQVYECKLGEMPVYQMLN